MADQVREAFEAWATTQDVGLPGSFTWIAARKGYLSATASHAADVEADRRDAERYRWLRDNPWPPELEADIRLHRNSRWDAAIDAARAALKGDKP